MHKNVLCVVFCTEKWNNMLRELEQMENLSRLWKEWSALWIVKAHSYVNGLGGHFSAFMCLSALNSPTCALWTILFQELDLSVPSWPDFKFNHRSPYIYVLVYYLFHFQRTWHRSSERLPYVSHISSGLFTIFSIYLHQHQLAFILNSYLNLHIRLEKIKG